MPAYPLAAKLPLCWAESSPPGSAVNGCNSNTKGANVTQATQKVVIISLDGATFDILQPLMQQGRMPNLRHLIESGLAANLASVVPPVTPPAWTSFMTGKHPSKHGIFGFMHFDPNSYSWTPNNSHYVQSKTIWQILSEKGKEVIVLNLPQTYPPYKVNGVMVSGWDSVSSEFTYPPELGQEILETMPGYYDSKLWLCELIPAKTRKEFDEFTGKLVASARQSTALARRLLDTRSWDAFMIHFHQTDWIQHKLWPDIERACDPKNNDARAERVREVYEIVDDCLGTIVKDTAAFEPMFVVLSDHGFSRHQGYLYPNHYLKAWGYLHTAGEKPQPKDPLKSVKDVFRQSRLAPVRNAYRAAAKFKQAFAGAQASDEYKEYSEKYKSWVELTRDNSQKRGRAIDWGRSRVVAVETYHCAVLFVNSVGRGPLGFVQPGPEYDAVVSDLISRFSEVRDPKTGKKLIARAARGAEIYASAGPNVLVPDVMLVPVEGYNCSADIVDAIPDADAEGDGMHHPRGVLVMAGKGIPARRNGLQPTLVDIAPTILHAMGLPVPTDMDGRVLQEAFASPQPVSYEEVDNALVASQVPYSAADAALIEQRLRGLGYIE